MKAWIKKAEDITDKTIPLMLVLLLVLIVIEIFFHELAEQYHVYILIADYVVIFVFVVDLVLKYNRIRHVERFLKECWLDILAVFPFFLLFRAVEAAAGVFSHGFGEGLKTTQHILHEGLELEKEGSKLTRFSKSTRFVKYARPLFRLPRFFKYLARKKRK